MGMIKLLSALCLAIGVALSGWFVAEAVVESRTPQRIVTVKGLAERTVKADLGFWPIRFVTTGPTLEIARDELTRSENAVRNFLDGEGFGDSDIQVQNIAVEDRFSGYNGGSAREELRFVLTEDLLVTSKDVDALGKAARAIADLLSAGVVFSSDAWSAGPSFVFTGINDLKSEMLTEATGRARETAEQFATESGSAVGNIKSANQGVFQVLPAVDIPNDRPGKQIDKKVRVVTTITYFLVD